MAHASGEDLLMKHVDVTIRMPEDWFDHFWGWYLDGGGDQMFLEGIDTTDCQENVTFADWDREKKLLIHSKSEAGLEAARNE